MPILTATSTFGEDAGVLPNSVIYTVSVPELNISEMLSKTDNITYDCYSQYQNHRSKNIK